MLDFLEMVNFFQNHFSFVNFNLNSLINIGSSSFVDELYSATFVKELGTPNHFFIYLLSNHSITSTFVIDTSYIYIDHDNLESNPK